MESLRTENYEFLYRGSGPCGHSSMCVNKALAYINEHYTERLSASKVAQEAFMSVSCFMRAFKKSTGLTFIEYLNRLRITHALTLLRRNELSISEIGFVCGYARQDYFTRVFKKLTKTTPCALREAMHKKEDPQPFHTSRLGSHTLAETQMEGLTPPFPPLFPTSANDRDIIME